MDEGRDGAAAGVWGAYPDTPIPDAAPHGPIGCVDQMSAGDPQHPWLGFSGE